MTTVTTEQIQKDFASVRTLIDRGETITLQEDGVDLGTLIPVAAANRTTNRERLFGALAGRIKVPDDFDQMMRDEIKEMFHGKP